MSNSNKVKFGLKNCHYAKATFDEDGNVTYEKPIRMPGAVSLSMDPEGENENFYADDIEPFPKKRTRKSEKKRNES